MLTQDTAIEEASRNAARQRFARDCEAMACSLPEGYFDYVSKVCHWLRLRLQTEPTRAIVGASGAQGSGKTTFATLVGSQLALQNKKTLVLSLDDFYLSKSKRRDLASRIHPLLQTRGVPGTHDIALLEDVKNSFRLGAEQAIPVFDKALDDRRDDIVVDMSQFEILILEGWCWGVTPCDDQALVEPINRLERDEDKDGIWRSYVNEQIKAYQSAFKTDYSIFFAVPDFEAVAKWRWQQEQGLEEGPGKMNFDAVGRFIMHYERLTQRLLDVTPATANLTLHIDKDHRFTRIEY